MHLTRAEKNALLYRKANVSNQINQKKDFPLRANLISAAATTSLLSMTASATVIQVGKALPNVQVNNKGELCLLNDITEYNDWSSNLPTGKIRLFQHLAGTFSAKKINLAFANKLANACDEGKLPEKFYQTTNIINLDESLFGTKNIVRSKLEKIKREFPEVSFVVDETGKIKQNWALEAKSSAVIALDEKGMVFFYKEGPLSDEEGSQLIDKLIYETKRFSQKCSSGKHC